MSLSETGKRNLLWYLMQDCPACSPDEAYSTQYSKLDSLLDSHKKNWYDLEIIPELSTRYETLLARLDTVIAERNAAKNALQRIMGHDCMNGNGIEDKCRFCFKTAQSILEPSNK